MAKEWFVRQGGKVAGPFDSERLKQLLGAGKLRDDAEVANDRNGPWHPKAKLKGFESPAVSQTQPPKTEVVSAPVQAATAAKIIDAPVIQSRPVPSTTAAPIYVQASHPTVNVQVNNSTASNSLGISSVILGIISFFVCWIPIVGFALSGLGLTLGFIGILLAIFRKGSGVGYSITGTALNGISVVIGVIYVTIIGAMISGINEVAKKTQEAHERQSRQAQPILPSDSEPNVPVESTPNPQEPTPNVPKAEPEKDVPSSTTEDVWNPADSPLRLGDVTVSITEVVFGQVPLKTIGRDGQSEEKLLMIRLSIKNETESKKINYRGWMTTFSNLSGVTCSLEDDAGNRYKQINFGINRVIGSVESDSIYPGESLSDAIVFERPIGTAKRLLLKFSGKGMEQEGEFRLAIPKEMIRTK
ncbi:MAG: hypothetical protein Q8M16_08450 [Pirellulaceae bacterium]|nr:hypothetical protein [Pirellulaceae bacterium]